MQLIPEGEQSDLQRDEEVAPVRLVHVNDVNMERVNEILHNIREALSLIREEGDTLQIFAIENQGTSLILNH